MLTNACPSSPLQPLRLPVRLDPLGVAQRAAGVLCLPPAVEGEEIAMTESPHRYQMRQRHAAERWVRADRECAALRWSYVRLGGVALIPLLVGVQQSWPWWLGWGLVIALHIYQCVDTRRRLREHESRYYECQSAHNYWAGIKALK